VCYSINAMWLRISARPLSRSFYSYIVSYSAWASGTRTSESRDSVTANERVAMEMISAWVPFETDNSYHLSFWVVSMRCSSRLTPSPDDSVVRHRPCYMR
jgi:hypothetical protein